MAARSYEGVIRVVLRLLALAVTGFFAATLILPLDTVGDPAFDVPMLRARWYFGFGLFWLHLALLAGLFWQMIRAPGLAAAAALALTATGLVLILAEESQLIRHGDLILPHDASMFRLKLNRLATAALSLSALIAVWRLHARR